MRLIDRPEDFNVSDLYVDLTSLFKTRVLLKCEGFNFAGSIKVKPALAMIEAAEKAGSLKPGGHIIESSSGNLGVAIAMIAATRGYEFTCVTDTRCNPGPVYAMRSMGSEVVVIDTPDPNGGLLGARLSYVAQAIREDPGLVWLNQYANDGNWRSHYATTAREIIEAVPEVHTVYVGVGTWGTVRGCAQYLREHRPDVKVVGVDSCGSINFGGAGGVRVLPGLGASAPMPLAEPGLLSESIYVSESHAVAMSRIMAARGYLFGASTCTVLAGVRAHIRRGCGVVGPSIAVSPDLGTPYLTSLYSNDWVESQCLSTPTG